MPWLRLLVVLPLISSAAIADDLATRGSAQAVGLFRQACLDHAGDAAGTRAFLDSHDVPRFSTDRAKPFLQAGSGTVSDASSGDIRLAVTSYDSGSCSVYTDHADRADVEHNLERLLSGLGMQYLIAVDHNNEKDPSIHVRAYHVKIGSRIFAIIASTAPTQIQAIMTLTTLAPADALPQDAQLGK